MRMLLAVVTVVVMLGCTNKASVRTASEAAERTAPPPSAAPSTAPAPSAPPQAAESARIVRVIDGDTVDIELASKTERVRLIGMDTPETVDPRTAVQCFGQEASARAKALLPPGAAVTIAADPTQDTRDAYGRMLAYLWLPDGRMFAEVMIAEGFSHEYTYRTPYQQQTAFKAAQQEAQRASRGLWSPATCAGNTKQPAARTTPRATAPAQAAPVTAADPSYPNCAAARAAGVAPLRAGQPGYRPALDRDRDGVACE